MKDKQSKQQLRIDLLQRYVLQEVHMPGVGKNGNNYITFTNGKWEIVTVGKVDENELIITKSGINERAGPTGLPYNQQLVIQFFFKQQNICKLPCRLKNIVASNIL